MRSDGESRAAALTRFEDLTDLPALVLAITMVPLIVMPLVVDLPETVDAAFVALDWFIWSAFAVQLGVRLWLTPESKVRFLVRNWADVLIVFVPFLRPLRIARSARALRLLGLARLGGVFGVIGTEARRLLTRHRFHYVVLVATLVVVGAAALVFHMEQGSGGTINSFPTAVWWAITTITTVGYGDTYPTTAAGRGVAAALMVVGIGFFSVVAANVAAFLVEQPIEEENQRLDEILRRLERIEAALHVSPDESVSAEVDGLRRSFD